MTQAIQKHEPQQIQHIRKVNPVAEAMAKLAADPTPENVASMQKLTELGIQFRKMDAEEEFNSAFAEMQAHMPQIVCDKKGPWGGDYADKEGIMRQIRPTLERYGFSIRFEHPPTPDPARLATVCVLAHAGGHVVRSEPMLTRAGRPNKMMTEIQVDAGGYYAGERYSLCAMLNIRADGSEEDARNIGMMLTTEELSDLKRHVAAAGYKEENPAVIFRMADVERWEDIRSGSLTVLHGFCDEKIRATKAKAEAK